MISASWAYHQSLHCTSVAVNSHRSCSQMNTEMPLADIDLHSLTLDQLKQLEKRVSAAITDFEDRRRADASAKVEELARSLGFTLRELADTAPVRRRSEATPKYRHPENPSITWSGRGRKPGWISDALSAGRSLDDLAI